MTNPTGNFRRTKPIAFCAVIFLQIFGVAILCPANAQQTEAEITSQSQRPMTKAERETLISNCTFPSPTGTAEFDENTFNTVQLETLTFLSMARIKPNRSLGQDPKDVDMIPLLPFGGIAGRDICEISVLFPLSDDIPRGQRLLALHLQKGLDLAADYPSSLGQIQKNKQLMSAPSGLYLILPTNAKTALDATDDLALTAFQIREQPMFSQDGLAFWLRGNLFIPLNKAKGAS